jgi:uncharacterized damage-inducible protein DinB
MTKEKALASLVESRQALHQAIEGLSEEQMTQVQVEGTWTVKDVIGHVSAWEELLAQPMRGYAEGGVFACDVIADYLAFNDEDAARKRDVPLDEILSQATAVRQDLVAAANELSAEQLEAEVTYPWGSTGTVMQGLSGLAVHEMEHAGAIQEWRQGDQVTG